MNIEDLEQARQELSSRFPNFGTLLSYWKGRFVPRPGQGTVSVDRYMRFYYDPGLDWSHKEILGAMEHELGHICRNHFQRMEQLEQETEKKVHPGRWNVAGDLEINDDLIHPLPEGYGVMPGKGQFARYGAFGIAEKYYGMMTRDKSKDPVPKPPPQPPSDDEEGEPQEGEPGDGEQDEGEDSAGGGGDGEGDAEAESEQQDGEGQGDDGPGEDGDSGPQGGGGSAEDGQDEGGDGEADQGDGGGGGYHGHEGDCGSVAGGPARDDELPMDDPDYPGVTPEQVERAVEEAKKSTGKQMADPTTEEGKAVNNQHGPGSGSGSMANSVFGPHMGDCYDHTWEAVLHREIARHMKTGGRSYQRPSRRLYDRKVIHEGRGKIPPVIAIVVDTSSSIGKEAAEKAFGIVAKFKGWNVRCRVVACDDSAKEVRPGDSGYSGGGTEMYEGVKYVKQHFGKVDACFVISDAEDYWRTEADFNAKTLGFPVTMFTWQYDGPDWMRTVRMPPLNEGHQTGIVGRTFNRHHGYNGY